MSNSEKNRNSKNNHGKNNPNKGNAAGKNSPHAKKQNAPASSERKNAERRGADNKSAERKFAAPQGKRNAVFAGTFDPFTIGHADIVRKCLNAYGRLILVVGENPDKKPLFPLEVRVRALKSAYGAEGRITISSFADNKNYHEFLKLNGVTDYVRGIRNDEDLRFERAAEEKNRVAYPEIRTAYVVAKEEFKETSSTRVREAIKKGEDFSAYVPVGAYKIYEDYLKANPVDD